MKQEDIFSRNNPLINLIISKTRKNSNKTFVMNKSSLLLFKGDYHEYKYVSFYFDEDKKYIKLIFKKEYETGDIPINYVKRAVNANFTSTNIIEDLLNSPHRKYFKHRLIHDVILSNNEYTIFYVDIENIKENLSLFHQIQWIKQHHKKHNKYDNILNVCKVKYGNSLVTITNNSILKIDENKTRIYLEYDEKINKVLITFQGNMFYGSEIIKHKNRSFGFSISGSNMNKILEIYNVQTESKRFFFKIAEYDTDVFIIEGIMESLECEIKVNDKQE